MIILSLDDILRILILRKRAINGLTVAGAIYFMNKDPSASLRLDFYIFCPLSFDDKKNYRDTLDDVKETRIMFDIPELEIIEE